MLVPMMIMSAVLLIVTTLVSVVAGGALGLGTGFIVSFLKQGSWTMRGAYTALFAVIGAAVSSPSFAIVLILYRLLDLPGGIGPCLGVWGGVLLIINLTAFAFVLISTTTLSMLLGKLRSRWVASS